MAGGFTETAFIKKLAELNNSSQSIQTLSLWLIHHRKHYSTVVKIWIRELIKVEKKGPEYGQEFGLHLKKAFEHMSRSDEKTKNSLDRLLTIWNDRGIYDGVLISEFKRALGKDEPPPSKRSKPNERKSRSPTRERKKSETEKIVEVVHVPPGDPPEPEELIRAIQELELNIASSDENVRERIAQLPREVSEVSLISKIEDKEAAEKLSVQVGEAVHLLSQYNMRLSAEMDHRKKVAIMMRDFLHVQEELLAQAERNLEVRM
ncbi:hypothetical protein NQ314_008621 [Rhamnusium bicolor]|uniref:CID domain-containing protein n=1 Tax=Rhamnusium bicolor TaxID=1586634 RepID=A0AAV8Y7B8_9CUCU|nr:hypothetical protein NQ314_008621 [Rhamnusium bicolor]